MQRLWLQALRVLNTADPVKKARLGDKVAAKWLQGAISQPYDPSRDFTVPDRTARLANVNLVAPSLMPKLGKAGSLQSRQASLHSLVHTESWAIDLSWVFLQLIYVTGKLSTKQVYFASKLYVGIVNGDNTFGIDGMQVITSI